MKRFMKKRSLTSTPVFFLNTCRSYIHTPHDQEPKGNCCERREGGDALDFELLGSKVHKNVRFPALDAGEPLCKI